MTYITGDKGVDSTVVEATENISAEAAQQAVEMEEKTPATAPEQASAPLLPEVSTVAEDIVAVTAAKIEEAMFEGSEDERRWRREKRGIMDADTLESVTYVIQERMGALPVGWWRDGYGNDYADIEYSPSNKTEVLKEIANIVARAASEGWDMDQIMEKIYAIRLVFERRCGPVGQYFFYNYIDQDEEGGKHTASLGTVLHQSKYGADSSLRLEIRLLLMAINQK